MLRLLCLTATALAQRLPAQLHLLTIHAEIFSKLIKRIILMGMAEVTYALSIVN